MDTQIDHANVPLRLYLRTTLAANAGPLTIEVERVTGTGGRGQVLVMAWEGIAGRILGKLFLLRMGGGLSVLLVGNA